MRLLRGPLQGSTRKWLQHCAVSALCCASPVLCQPRVLYIVLHFMQPSWLHECMNACTDQALSYLQWLLLLRCRQGEDMQRARMVWSASLSQQLAMAHPKGQCRHLLPQHTPCTHAA